MLQNEVFLEPIKHIYTGVSDGRIYDSTSKVLNSIEEYVDWWEVAGKVAGNGKFKGLSQQQVSDMWSANGKESSDHGTYLHSLQEKYAKEFKIGDVKYEKGIKHIASMFSNYYKEEFEATVYSKTFGVAGTGDRFSFLNKGYPLISISDYKTALKKEALDFFHKDGKRLLSPVDHLQQCKYIRYALQLSIYGVMAEECCGLEVNDLNIIFIPTDPAVLPYKIPVPYMRTDAIAILKHFGGKSNVVEVNLIEEETTAPDFYIE